MILATLALALWMVDDPAPPVVRALPPVDAPSPAPFEGLVTHAAPRPLASGAVVRDWPTFLGPRRDAHCDESPLAMRWGEAGPTLLWEMPRGAGLASPVVVGERVVFTHRVADEVHVDCLEATTGRRFWRASFPTDYRPRYIRNDGPRSTPTIAGDRVYVHEVGGALRALELTTGRVVWQRDLSAEFGLTDGFFGVVSSPLVVGDDLIVNVGAPGPTVAAFDRHTGRLRWETPAEWGASCASPVLAAVGGRERLLVLTGGESRPPTGGLLVLEPRTGAEEFRHSFRSTTVESVNGASPLVAGDLVFLTAAYGVGSVGIGLDPEGALRPLWSQRRLGIEFSQPVFSGGRVFVVDGRSDRAGAVVAVDPATGAELSRDDLAWDEHTVYGGRERDVSLSIGAGSLLAAEGRLLCLGDNGHLLWLAIEEGGVRVLQRHWLFRSNESWTPPVVSHGLLYVCQNNPERFGSDPRPPRLLCYDLRGGD